MNKLFITLITGIILLSFSTGARSHDVVGADGKPVTTHTHVWRPQAYGQDYRQGHSVDGPQGSITTWSPNTYRGYNAGRSVQFARPEPLRAGSAAGGHKPVLNSGSRANYGQSSHRN